MRQPAAAQPARRPTRRCSRRVARPWASARATLRGTAAAMAVLARPCYRPTAPSPRPRRPRRHHGERQAWPQQTWGACMRPAGRLHHRGRRPSRGCRGGTRLQTWACSTPLVGRGTLTAAARAPGWRGAPPPFPPRCTPSVFRGCCATAANSPPLFVRCAARPRTARHSNGAGAGGGGSSAGSCTSWGCCGRCT
eukprot:353037-Chlamydomonas_euryale.AAC.6